MSTNQKNNISDTFQIDVKRLAYYMDFYSDEDYIVWILEHYTNASKCPTKTLYFLHKNFPEEYEAYLDTYT